MQHTWQNDGCISLRIESPEDTESLPKESLQQTPTI